VYIVAVTKHNVDGCLVFELLNKIVRVFKSYFQTVDEESLKSNYVLVNEILDGTTWWSLNAKPESLTPNPPDRTY